MRIIIENPVIYRAIWFVCIFFGGYITWKIWRIRKPQENCKKEANVIGNESIIKQGFRINAVPGNLDVIVIGSGIAGLTVASLMAQEGNKVLLLEQHDVIGGSTHTFKDKGYEFETGLHYVGNEIGDKKSLIREYFDCITKNAVEWERMDDVYDVAIVHDGENYEQYPIHSEVNTLKKTLISSFPEDEIAIHEYFTMIKKAYIGITVLFILKCIPYQWMQRTIRKVLHPFLSIFDETTEQILSKLTNNKKLIGVLTYNYLTYGEAPSRSSFGMHALLSCHYIGGGFFPIGGPSMIARSIVPIIENSKGKAFVRAPVSSIIINDENKAIGVVVKGHRIFSKIVVSAISSSVTYKNLIPETFKDLLQSHLTIIESPEVSSEGTVMMISVGLESDMNELNLPKRNIWIFPSWNHDENMKRFRNDPDADFPAMFITFASAKDPTYQHRYPKKSVACIIVSSFYEHVEKYKQERVRHRSDEYNQLKDQWKNRLLQIFFRQFPHLKDKIVHVDCGTAITNDFYLGTYRGSAYGLAHTPQRFREVEILSPKSPIKNLYLSGQDMLTCGIVPSILSGFMTSYTISPGLLFKYRRLHLSTINFVSQSINLWNLLQ